MKRLLLFLVSIVGISSIGLAFAQPSPDFLLAQSDNNFAIVEESVSPLENYIEMGTPARGAGGIRDFVINTFYDVVFPLIFGVGLLMAILGIIGLMFSDKEEERSKALRIVMRGVIGIILIVSARYLTYVIVGDTGTGGLLMDPQTGNVSGVFVANDLYDKVLAPFISVGFTLIAGVLFVVLLIRVLGMLFNPSDDNRKQSLAIIGWNTLGILIIIGAKSIVELLYGKKEQIVNGEATQLSEIGGAIFNTEAASGSIGLFYAIINRVMGLTSLIVLIIIVFQAYRLLTNPEDESKLAQVGKSLMYIFVGIIIIGLSYVIANVFLIQ